MGSATTARRNTEEERQREENHSLAPTTEYLSHDDDFQRDNFDTYLERIGVEPNPDEVTKPGSFWRTAWHFLFSGVK